MSKPITEAELSVMENDLASPSNLTVNTYPEYAFRAWRNQTRLIAEVRRLRAIIGDATKCAWKFDGGCTELATGSTSTMFCKKHFEENGRDHRRDRGESVGDNEPTDDAWKEYE